MCAILWNWTGKLADITASRGVQENSRVFSVCMRALVAICPREPQGLSEPRNYGMEGRPCVKKNWCLTSGSGEGGCTGDYDTVDFE